MITLYHNMSIFFGVHVKNILFIRSSSMWVSTSVYQLQTQTIKLCVCGTFNASWLHIFMSLRLKLKAFPVFSSALIEPNINLFTPAVAVLRMSQCMPLKCVSVFSRLCVCLLLFSQSECGFSCSELASNLNVNKWVILNWENQCVNVGEIWSCCSGHVEYISLLLWFRASFSTINLYLAQKTSWKFNKPVNFAEVQDPEVAFLSRALIFASQTQ